MSAIAESAYSKMQAMPTELQQQALDFIDFLMAKNLESQSHHSDKTQNLQIIMQRIAETNTFDEITDPLSWQKELRQDRELPR